MTERPFPVRIVEDNTWWDYVVQAAPVVGPLLVLAGLAFAWRQLRESRRTRHGQLIMDLSRRWDDADVLESARLLRLQGPEALVALVDMLWAPDVESRPPDYLDLWLRLSVQPNVIEAIAVLRDEKAVRERVIYKMWGAGIITTWDQWQHAVRRLREHQSRPEIWRYFEELAASMRKRERGVCGAGGVSRRASYRRKDDAYREAAAAAGTTGSRSCLGDNTASTSGLAAPVRGVCTEVCTTRAFAASVAHMHRLVEPRSLNQAQ